MVDHAAEMSFKPDVGTKSEVVRQLLETSRNELFDINSRLQRMAKVGVPLLPVFTVSINKASKAPYCADAQSVAIRPVHQLCRKTYAPPITARPCKNHFWSVTCRPDPIPLRLAFHGEMAVENR